MEHFDKSTLIPCYRESKQDCCKECRLSQAVKRMPNGIDDKMEALVSQVLDPACRIYGKPITVVSGFRCPVHNGTICASRQSAHVRGEAADITAGSPEENQVLYDILQSLGVCTELILHTTYIHVSL